MGVMEGVGNKVANDLYFGGAPEGAKKPDRDAPQSEKLQFVKAKYEQKRWVSTELARKTAVMEVKQQQRTTQLERQQVAPQWKKQEAAPQLKQQQAAPIRMEAEVQNPIIQIKKSQPD